MKVFTEAVEVCPHCEGENVFPNWDVKTQDYESDNCMQEIYDCDSCIKNGDCLDQGIDGRPKWEALL